MPGFLLTTGSSVSCGHQFPGMPTGPVPRVQIDRASAVLGVPPYAVACTTVTPCGTGTWVTMSTRVLSYGQPLALQESPGVCASGAPLIARVVQTRVRAI